MIKRQLAIPAALVSGCLLAVTAASVGPSVLDATTSGASAIERLVDANTVGRETGFALPRFVSLASDRARVRYGPGFQYDVQWVYLKRGLPLEIVAEFGNWREVRDFEGAKGWIHHSLLSGARTAMVGPWLDALQPLRESPHLSGAVIARMEPNLIVRVSACDRMWCTIQTLDERYVGHALRSILWGVYPAT